MREFLRQYLVPALCGAALALAFPTYHIYPLAWVALAPLVRRTHSMTPRAAGMQFFVAGFVFHLVLLQWLMSNVYWAGGWAWWGYVALSFILAMFWFVTGAAWRFMASKLTWVPRELLLPIVWGAMEFVMSFAFTGFGWSAIAYSQASDLWLAQWAAIGGVPLVSAFVVTFNALLAEAWAEKRARILRAGTAVVMLFITHGIGAMMMGTPNYESQPLKAAIVQADFPLEMKWDPEYAVDMVRNAADKSRVLTNGENIDLIVWPEALIMEDIETPGIIDEVSTLARDSGAYLFAGAHRTNPETDGSMNAAYLVDPDGVVADYYDKIHLAPFGEYVPLREFVPFIGKVVPAIGDIEHGTTLKTFETKGRELGPLICFEVLFPWMSEALRNEGADYLVVVTNLGWFGRSNAIAQELEVARMRAIETRLPLVHCANTGISGVFDPWGRFSVVNVYFRDATHWFDAEIASNSDVIMSRFGGVFPVAAPVDRPMGSGPSVVPNVFLALALTLTALSCALAWIHKRRHRQD
ncbi:MAG: apolipoprotein N-acyltransferase [Candidatus Hydrogenedentes bacterium]|nr:apolipoprotein N-acyltransferase [Candidatus Hydrogenedentota bacterium]